MSPEMQPYVGPRPFESGDQALFFGRDQEISDLLSLIVAHGEVLVYAQSGAGKTSLFNAGIIPLLETRGFDVLPVARVRGSIPESIKAKEIANLYVFNAVLSWAEHGVGPDQLTQTTLSDYLRHRKRPIAKNAQPSPRVVIFDQFEELFSSYPERWEDREAFFEQVRDTLEEDPLLRVVFIIREDYLAQLDPYARLLPEELHTRFRLERMGREAALSAIVGPLAGIGRCYADGVAEKLVEELLKVRVDTLAGKSEIITGEFIEPVQLQVVCQNLWQELPPTVTVVTQDHLHEFGDVNQALSKFYEQSIERAAQATHVSEGDLRKWFERSLITPAGTRGSVYYGLERTDGIPNAAVVLLEDLHLIRGEWRAGARWYELTHDRFIEPIQKANRQWMAKNWEAEQARERLEAKAAEWVDMGRGKGALVDAIELHEAEHWLDSARAAGLNFSADVTALMEASRAAVEEAKREQEAARRRELDQARALAAAETARAEEAGRSARRAKWSSAAVVFAVLAIIAAWFAHQEKEVAEQDKRLALARVRSGQAVAEQNARLASARELSRVAISELASNPERGVQIALHAVSKTYSIDKTVTKEAEEALHQALRASRTRLTLPGHSRVNRIAVSPNGMLLATAGSDGTVRLSDIFSGLQKFDPLKPVVRAALNVEFDDSVPIDLARRYGLEEGAGALIEKATKGGAADKAGLKPNDVILKIDNKQIDTSNPLQEVIAAFQPGSRVKVEFMRENQLQTLEAILGERPIEATSIAVDPDGTRLAAASWHTVKVWDIASDKAKAILSLEHDARVNDVAFSPAGMQLATASGKGYVALWNAQTGQKMRTLPPIFQPDIGITPQQITLDQARRLGLARSLGVLVRKVAREGAAERAGVERDDVIVTINGKAIDTLADFNGAIERLPPGGDGRVELIRKGQSETVMIRVDKRPVGVSSLAYSPDGASLAVVYGNRAVKLWDARSGKEGLTLSGHTNRVFKVAFSPTGKLLATASADGTAKMWDLSNGKETRSLSHDNEVYDVVFNPDGKILATAGRDRRINLWRSDSGQALFSLSGHNEPVRAVVFSPDGKDLISASDDKTLRVWEVDQRDGLALAHHQRDIWGIAFSPDGKHVATASSDGTARVWDFYTGEELTTLGGGGGWNVAFSPDGGFLFTAGGDRSARIWDVASGKELKTLVGHTDILFGLALNRDGTRLATGSRDGTAGLWDAVSGEKLFELPGQDTVLSVAFSPDGKRLATASFDRNVKIWDVATGKELLTLPSRHNDAVWSVAFSPDGKYLASASSDGTVILWDLSSNTALYVFSGHAAGLTDVAFSPDGKRLATVSADKTIKLWDVASHKETLSLSGQDAAFNRVAFSPDGKFLAAGSADGTAHIYALGVEDLMALARRRITRSLTKEECEKYLEQELCPPTIKALDSFVRGKTLAKAGDIDGAVASFEESLKQDPALGFDPQKEARRLAAAHLVTEGNHLAQAGALETAIQHFQKATQLDPNLDLEPQTKAKRLAAMERLTQGAKLAERGKIADAITAYKEAQSLDPTLNIRAYQWNNICWFGSLYQKARDIIFACEQAVALAPDSGPNRDSRGVARALTGDFKGAIEDFEAAYVDPIFEARKPRLRQWVAILRKGKNPFTQEELKKLLND